MWQLVYTIFISNNRPLFQLWRKENLVKHQKVSNYYEKACCLWYPKIPEIINWNLHCDLQFIANSGKSINQKRTIDTFLFIQNDFWQLTGSWRYFRYHYRCSTAAEIVISTRSLQQNFYGCLFLFPFSEQSVQILTWE